LSILLSHLQLLLVPNCKYASSSSNSFFPRFIK
jgi:hypothetical protein